MTKVVLSFVLILTILVAVKRKGFTGYNEIHIAGSRKLPGEISMFFKNRNYWIARLVLILALSWGAVGAVPARAQAMVYRVAPEGAVSGSCGADWANPCDLQYVLDVLTSQSTGGEVWVKAGTYFPGEDRRETFELRNGVALYGGFAGTETTRAQRELGFHFSILDGDIGTRWFNGDNSYHVVSSYNTDSTAVLDGFTITGGNSNDNEN